MAGELMVDWWWQKANGSEDCRRMVGNMATWHQQGKVDGGERGERARVIEQPQHWVRNKFMLLVVS